MSKTKQCRRGVRLASNVQLADWDLALHANIGMERDARRRAQLQEQLAIVRAEQERRVGEEIEAVELV